MNRERELSAMRAVAAKARQAAEVMEYEDRVEMRRLADELAHRADEL